MPCDWSEPPGTRPGTQRQWLLWVCVTAEFGSTSMFDIISHLARNTETELKRVMVKAVRWDFVLVSAGIVCSVLTASVTPPLGPWEITSRTVTKRQEETRAARREADGALLEKTFVSLKEIGCLKRKHTTLETQTPAHTFWLPLPPDGREDQASYMIYSFARNKTHYRECCVLTQTNFHVRLNYSCFQLPFSRKQASTLIP